MQDQKKKMRLPKVTVDDFFSTQEDREDKEKERVEQVNISDIVDFKNHPFKVEVNDEMIKMKQSIEEYGVLVPALVRPIQNGKYEMISGHRRKKASELANIKTIPCIIRDLTDDEATIIMVDSNMQREHILPSERAFAYKLKLEALSHQGKRNDLTLSPLETKLKSAEIIGENSDSRAQVYRYIRLTELIPELLNLVDKETIAFRPAVELSYLSNDEQKMLFDIIEYNDCTPSLSQAIQLKRLSNENKLTSEVMEALMEKEKPNQIEKYKVSAEKLKSLLPRNLNEKEREDYIVKAVTYYNNHIRKRSLER